jgi:hypothetical protein
MASLSVCGVSDSPHLIELAFPFSADGQSMTLIKQQVRNAAEVQ